jgi:hypothetical protein
MILLAVWQRVALVIEISARQSISRSWSTKVLHHNILLQIHQGTTYFASPIYSHVGVASHNNSIYVASTNAYGYHVQESLGFNATRNIQHAYPYSSAISSQYMVPPQDMLIYERIGYGDATIQSITLNSHMMHDMLIEQMFYLQIQRHMQMLVLIIWPHIFLITMAELMKFQQGIQVLMLMIRPHILLITMAKSIKIQKDMLVLKLMIRLPMLLKTIAKSMKIH